MAEVSAADLFDLSGEVALVTGASSGLGRRFAEVLAGHGARVVLAARRTDRLEDLKQQIEASGGAAEVLALDVADASAIPEAFEAAEAAFGTVTIAVNNAGISGQKRALEMDEADWRQVLAINLDAVWTCSQEAARRLVKANRPGTIINVGSVLSYRVAPTLAAYAVSKAGVKQLTAALAVEWARHDIRVNAIAPGYIETEINSAFFASDAGAQMIRQIPQRRIGQPSDLDGTLLLLASRKAAGFMTGTTVVVDGGHMLGIG